WMWLTKPFLFRNVSLAADRNTASGVWADTAFRWAAPDAAAYEGRRLRQGLLDKRFRASSAQSTATKKCTDEADRGNVKKSWRSGDGGPSCRQLKRCLL